MRPIIGISMGDPAGVGPEIAVKALLNEKLYKEAIPVIVGDLLPIEDAIQICGLDLRIHLISSIDEAEGHYGTIDLLDLARLDRTSWKYGEVSSAAGNAAYCYITEAIDLAMKGQIDAVVTGPINKESLNISGHHFSGHTEIFAKFTNTTDYAMLLTTPNLSVIHVTTHCSIRNACDKITEKRVYTVINLAQQALLDLGIASPRIGVAGLNPHSSENGLFGDEEEKIIVPAIRRSREAGIQVDGPIPPDTAFVKALAGQYDIIVAMYHDQGHIPIKLLGFRADANNQFSSVQGVNITVGLPIIRTSVDHGTAFDKAGQGTANEGSMVDACFAAALLARNKKLRNK